MTGRWGEESNNTSFRVDHFLLGAGISVAYIPLSLDPATPRAVAWIIRDAIENLFLSDVHAMLRLPLPDQGIGAGQNFAAVQVLMCVISGVSVLLYDNRLESGESFKGLIENYFPWDEEPGPKRAKKTSSGILYDVFRSPLTHNVGIAMNRRNGIYYPVEKSYVVKLERFMPKGSNTGHPEEWVEQLERSPHRPRIGATLTMEPHKRVLHVEGLYWGTRRMIEKLTSDPARMHRADGLIAPHLKPRHPAQEPARAGDVGRSTD